MSPSPQPGAGHPTESVPETLPRSTQRWFHHSFWRVYLYSVFVVLTTTTTTVVLMHLSNDRPLSLPEGLAQYLASEIQRTPASSQHLHHKLQDLHAALGVDLAVYRVDGTRLGAVGASLPPLDPDTARSLTSSETLFRRSTPEFIALLPVSSAGRAYLIMSNKSVQPITHIVKALLIIFLFLALLSLPVAWLVSRPIERLTSTARKLAQGDLQARTHLTRRDQVGQLARTMDEMAEKLEHHVRREKELLANISHEIRTPLARIRVALEICEEQGELAAVKAHLVDIGQDVVELEQLLRDVFIITRLDLSTRFCAEGSLTLRRDPHRLRDLADEVTKRFAHTYPEHRLDLDFSVDLPLLSIDAALIRRVLENLIVNAAKYSSPDTTIELAVKLEQDVVAVEVRDRGIGVPEKELSHLFDPFYQTERSKLRGGAGGTGLGLTLCKRIVQAHGGTISAACREQGGTIVRFSLPLS